MKKEISATTLLIIAVVSYAVKFLAGGVIGDVFGLLGIICLLLGLVRFFTKKKDK